MSQPSIAILHYASPPTIGGVESTIAAHARLFADHGYAVKIITGHGEPFDPRVPVQVIPDVGSRSPRVSEVNAELARGIVGEKFQQLVEELIAELVGQIVVDPRNSKTLSEANGEMEGGNLSYIIVHNALSLHKNLALTAALKNLADAGRIRLIAWCHDFAWTDPQYAREVHPGFPWDLLRQPWEGVKYVVVSEARKRELQELWGRGVEIAVVPPGLDPLAFLGVTAKTARWARDFALLDAEPLLLLPARLTRRKNIEYAMEITAALRERGQAARLVITGPPGPHNPTNVAYLETLRGLRETLGLQDAAIFLYEFGAVDDATLRDLFLLADALLFPSEREGFGIPLLEAGLTRLPTFCSDIAPFRESAGEHAHYLPPGQSPPDAAAQIATTLAQDSAYRLKKRVLREYAWERVFKERIEPLILLLEHLHAH
ncbi:MAG: glycosyltransferase family 4 protein [Chloroflexi bacterium]|nr:glycosyltransferase family 4 protein [Chloroflexota bacterium]